MHGHKRRSKSSTSCLLLHILVVSRLKQVYYFVSSCCLNKTLDMDWKNEFRKARAARQQGQQGVTAVTLTVESFQDSELDLSQPLCPPAPLIVSVPLQSVSLFTLSLDKSVYLHAPVRSLTTLRSRLQALPVLPKGDLTLILTGAHQRQGMSNS